MIAIFDLFNKDDFNNCIDNKYIRLQYHPNMPLAVANYTEKAQYDRHWTPATEQCRGLVFNHETYDIVGRPFRKFHNYGTPEAPVLSLDTPVFVHDKLDGSMILLSPAYSYDGPVFSTRGSFTSTQAREAVNIFNDLYDDWDPLNDFSYLFEVIYPENRIVIDYGDQRDLVLLGVIDPESGVEIPPEHVNWPGPKAEKFSYDTLAQALAAPARPGKEGFVISTQDSIPIRVKLKQEDYVALHRIVTGLNARTVWAHMNSQATWYPNVNELIEGLPDEFHQWVKDVALELGGRVRTDYATAWNHYVEVLGLAGEGCGRKEFALATKNKVPGKYVWAMFAFLDGDTKRALTKFWYDAKPEADWTPVKRDFGEDSA